MELGLTTDEHSELSALGADASEEVGGAARYEPATPSRRTSRGPTSFVLSRLGE